jgi:hypothetical protein
VVIKIAAINRSRRRRRIRPPKHSDSRELTYCLHIVAGANKTYPQLLGIVRSCYGEVRDVENPLRPEITGPDPIASCAPRLRRSPVLLSAGGRHRGGGRGESGQLWPKTAGCPVPQSLY